MTTDHSKPALTKTQSALVAFLFEGRPSLLAAPLTGWIAASPRYAAFVEQYKDKIRKKLRVTHGAGPAADLLYELQISYWLLQERRFEPAYEPYLAGKTRGPDYSVTFRTNFTFNIEVTHLRLPAAATAGEAGIDFRLVDVLCDKLRQMLANMANLLFIMSTPAGLELPDLPAHIAWIKERAERGETSFYTRQRFSNASEFFKYYERLSGVVVYDPAGAQQAVFWSNPQARVKLPEAAVNSLRRVVGMG